MFALSFDLLLLFTIFKDQIKKLNKARKGSEAPNKFINFIMLVRFHNLTS